MIRSQTTQIGTVTLAALMLSGCQYAEHNRKPFVPPANAAAAVYIDAEGRLVGADNVRPGKPEQCRVPTEAGNAPVCRGLEKGAEVQAVSSLVILQSKVNPVCLTFFDSRGAKLQVCWEE